MFEWCLWRLKPWINADSIKGTLGYENKLFIIDSQWLMKTNGATFIFTGKLGNEFLRGQFWNCLSFASLSVPSGMALSPDFLSCWPKLRPLYCCDMKLCDDGVWRYGLNGSRQLLSQLRIMHFNSKIISWDSAMAQNKFLLASFFAAINSRTYPRKFPSFDNLGYL